MLNLLLQCAMNYPFIVLKNDMIHAIIIMKNCIQKVNIQHLFFHKTIIIRWIVIEM